MKKWLGIYGAWILGVLSAAGVAYWYWVKYLGDSIDEGEV